eukprot:10322809-Ditylum_brightwellii.AAC.1
MVVDATARECDSLVRGKVAVEKVSEWDGAMVLVGTSGEGDRKQECIIQLHALTSVLWEWTIKEKTHCFHHQRCSRRERMVDSIIPRVAMTVVVSSAVSDGSGAAV